jgi:hypothetical protein
MNGLSQLDADYIDLTIKGSIGDGQYHPLPLPAPNDKPLNAMHAISDLWPRPLPNRQIQILVSLPAHMSTVALGTGNPSNDLAPMVTLITISRGVFVMSDVNRNNIHELDGPEPDFLTAFKTRLKQCRWIESGTEVCFFKSHMPSSY